MTLLPTRDAGPGGPATRDARIRRFDTLRANMLADVRRLVECESPSSDLAAVARSAGEVAAVGERILGVRPELIKLDGVTHVRWRLGRSPTRVLVLGHHDTVWPIGSLDRHPFATNDGVMRGPGCLDMKAGLIQGFYGVAECDDRSGITILITGDEEIGSPTSRTMIEAEARGLDAVLVLEAAADGGSLKTARKGTSDYTIEIVGRAAHAGLEPEQGVNATIETAHQILALAGLNDPGRGTTVTPTRMSSGTAANTVPSYARLAVDVRAVEALEQGRIDTVIRGLAPTLDGAEIVVTGGPSRPPFPATASDALYQRTAKLAEDLGLRRPGRASVGGASDGNLTAGIGTPTLDGLGAVGGGAHADDEHVVIATMPERAALLAAILGDVLGLPGR